MPQSVTIMLAVLAIVVCLGSRRVRSYFTMIALRRFFDKYMSRPRYRAYNLRSEDDDE